MKLASALLVFLPSAVAFQVRHSTAAVGPLNSAQFNEPSISIVDFANGGDVPNIVPDIAPADLIYQAPDPVQIPGPVPVLVKETAEVPPPPSPNVKVLGKVPGSEQASITGRLLGMDKGFKAKTAITMVADKTPLPEGMIKVPKIKCFQTSKNIQRYAYKGPFPKTISIDELLNPKTF
mmetsp:Transcript_68220/g.197621  ORF Transcript_68220/g.197621 Transcript_68220/m.197621 type:complete len:178 (+) Transcript_68220:93-626(+)